MKLSSLWFIITDWIESNGRLLEIILTITAIIVAWCLLNETKNQVKISREAVDSSNVYSRRTVEIADSSMRVGNRAYISANAMVDPSAHTHAKIKIVVNLQNVGVGSPAYHVRARWWFDTTISHYGKYILQSEKAIADTNNPEMSDMIVGKGDIFRTYGTWTFGDSLLSNAILKRLKTGRDSLFIYGVIGYSDVFGEKHRTYFCTFGSTNIDTIALFTYYKYNYGY